MFDRISGICLPPESYWDSLFGWDMLATVWRSIQIDMNKKIALKENVPDAPVVLLENIAEKDNDALKLTSLLSHASRDRPFVLNFGCLTCPVFTTKMKVFRSILSDFGDVADFALVYIEEAHPADGWAFKVKLSVVFDLIV